MQDEISKAFVNWDVHFFDRLKTNIRHHLMDYLYREEQIKKFIRSQVLMVPFPCLIWIRIRILPNIELIQSDIIFTANTKMCTISVGQFFTGLSKKKLSMSVPY